MIGENVFVRLFVFSSRIREDVSGRGVWERPFAEGIWLVGKTPAAVSQMIKRLASGCPAAIGQVKAISEVGAQAPQAL